jgi:hypothetical protein
MQRNIDSLTGYNMVATDGEIGKVIEFFFDDEIWFVRYMILKTGDWLHGRKVLISPDALKKTSWETGVFSVNITKEQVRDSPAIDTDKPVYRSQEIELYAHYDWESEWGSQFYDGGSMGESNPVPIPDREILTAVDKADIRSNDQLHLRSTAIFLKFKIQATDGAVGPLVDLVMDDQSWKILYLVAEIPGLPGKTKILIAVDHIRKIEWDLAIVFVDITLAAVEGSDLFKESTFKPSTPGAPDEIH